MLLGIRFETRTEYAIEYLEEILDNYKNIYMNVRIVVIAVTNKNVVQKPKIIEV